MRKYFITGIAILLPLALTVIILVFLINLMTGPFLGFVKEIMNYYGILQDGFFIFSSEQVQNIVSKILIILFFFVFTILLGILTRWVVVFYMLKFGDYIIHKIPLVNTIYKTFQDVFKTIFTGNTSSFKQVVILPFPNFESFTLGLVTKEEVFTKVNEKRVAVFVPTTPNPTSGYLLFVKEEDLTYLDTSVEEALKYIISCGVVLVPFHKISKEEARKRMEVMIQESEVEDSE